MAGPIRPSLEMTSYQLRATYDHPAIGFAVSPTGNWPLTPSIRSLGQAGTVNMDLFTATAAYLTLATSSATVGTGLRLQQAGSGADLPSSAQPYMVIVRTK